MKDKIKILILCLGAFSNINAQEPKGKRLYSGEVQNISYLVYPLGTTIKAETTSPKELDYKYPESLMLSIMSCTNTEWEAFFIHLEARKMPI